MDEKDERRERREGDAEERARTEAAVAAEAAEGTADETSPEEDAAYWKDRFLRANADLQNVRRRAAEDVEARVVSRLEAILHDLMEVDDYLAHALGNIPEDVRRAEQADAFLAGIQAIREALERVLRTHGLEVVEPAEGEPFDPTLHEALEMLEEEGRREPRLEVVRRGYRIGNRILRPAKVRVVRPKTAGSGSGAAPAEDSDRA